jgi:hypothetical protein
MDRWRNRRRVEDEDYSDGETVTPPPSRGQATAGARVSGSMDGPYDAIPRRSQEAPTSPTGGAFNKGYKLSSPPMGGQQQMRSAPPNNYPYGQQPQYRRASAPVSQKHSQQVPGPYGRGQDEFSEGSLTPSDELEDGPMGRTPGVPPPRRLSKAQRFLGIGDEGGRRGSAGDYIGQDDGGYVDGRPEKTRPKWMIWK